MHASIRSCFLLIVMCCACGLSASAHAQSARLDAVNDRALLLIETTGSSLENSQRVLTELSQLTGEGPTRADGDLQAHALVSVPNESITPEIKALLERHRVEVNAVEGTATTSVTFKGLSFSKAKLQMDRLQNLEQALASQSLAVPMINKNDLVQMTIEPKLGGIAVLLPPKKKHGGGSVTGALQGTPECIGAASKVPYIQDLATLLNQAKQTQATQNAVAFRNACLNSITGPDAPGALPSFVREAASLQIMGVLEYSSSVWGDVVFCSAFLVDASRIVTARHCFYEGETAGAFNTRHAGIAAGNVFFRRLSPPYQRSRVNGELPPLPSIDPLAGGDPRRPIRAQADILVLRLEITFADVPAIKWASAPDWRHRAWTAGPVDFYELGGHIDDGIPASIKAVRYPAGFECSVLPQGEGCHAHICQTVGAFSGAPILLKGTTDNELVVGGMHLGPYATEGRNCPAFKQSTSAGITDVSRDVNLAVAADLVLARINFTPATNNTLKADGDEHAIAHLDSDARR